MSVERRCQNYPGMVAAVRAGVADPVLSAPVPGDAPLYH